MAPTPTTTAPNKSSLRTLASLLKYFVGLTVTVELKNGRLYKGELTEADKCMNLSLEGAVDITSTSNKTKNQNNSKNAVVLASFMELSIRGSTIRYIHFPDNCDIPLTIKGGQDRERRVSNKYQRGVRKSK
jgi:small nuclear ribonucleoprotein (snRNP)-like protein